MDKQRFQKIESHLRVIGIFHTYEVLLQLSWIYQCIVIDCINFFHSNQYNIIINNNQKKNNMYKRKIYSRNIPQFLPSIISSEFRKFQMKHFFSLHLLPVHRDIRTFKLTGNYTALGHYTRLFHSPPLVIALCHFYCYLS